MTSQNNNIIPSKHDEYYKVHMDLNQHKLVTSVERAVTAHIPANAFSRDSAFDDGVDNYVKQKGISDSTEEADLSAAALQAISLVTSPSWFTEPVEECAIVHARRRQLIANPTGADCMVYQQNTVIYESMQCSAAFEAKLRARPAIHRFSDLAIWLKQIAVNPDMVQCDKHSLLQIDNMLTTQVNSLLANNMGLVSDGKQNGPIIEIDSFIEDIGELISHIDKKFGKAYSSALAGYQKEFIKTHFTLASADHTDAYIADSFNDVRDSEVTRTIAFSKNMSITHIGVLAKELGMRFDTCYASAIHPSEFATLHRLTDSIVTSYEEMEADIAKHLLITSDNKRFQLYRGLIGNRWILIRAVS